MVMGLAASLFQGIAASLSFCLSSSLAREISASSSRQRQQKKRSHTIPTLLWAMADCTFSREHQVVYQYQRPSVVNSLLHAKSDMTAQALAYSLSGNSVKIFLCHLSHWCRDGISMR